VKVGDIYKQREAGLYPTPEEILSQAISEARKAYPQHVGVYSDDVLVALWAQTLAKVIEERKAERDAHRARLQELGYVVCRDAPEGKK
jgi:hypothetical protein